MRTLLKSLSLISLLLVLIACTDTRSPKEEASQASVSDPLISQESKPEEEANTNALDFTIDQRFVPEFNQVEAELYQMESFQLKEQPKIASDYIFRQQRNSMQFTVDELRVYEITEYDAEVWQDTAVSEPAAIIIIYASMTNLLEETSAFPIQQIRMSQPIIGKQIPHLPEVYPSASGDLSKILAETNYQIAPRRSVEGYLTFVVGQEDWQMMASEGNFSLLIPETYEAVNFVLGQNWEELEPPLALFLPLNGYNEQMLINNAQRIPDRIMTDWLGEKDIIAEEQINTEIQAEDFTLVLQRIELSDFIPNRNNTLDFSAFPHGQVILSLQFDLDNQTGRNLYPYQEAASIQIGADIISSSNALVNEEYNEALASGMRKSYVQTFVLDRQKYSEDWQEKAILINLSILEEPVKAAQIPNRVMHVNAEYNSNPRELQPYYIDYMWEPQIIKRLTSDN